MCDTSWTVIAATVSRARAARNSFAILLRIITYNRNELVQIVSAVGNWLYHGLDNSVCTWSPFKMSSVLALAAAAGQAG